MNSKTKEVAFIIWLISLLSLSFIGVQVLEDAKYPKEFYMDQSIPATKFYI